MIFDDESPLEFQKIGRKPLPAPVAAHIDEDLKEPEKKNEGGDGSGQRSSKFPVIDSTSKKMFRELVILYL